ncbi:hypothetical protein [Actinomycetospora sp. NBRC 106378]|uniref:hypothetical protein n=1 Tax=Actinomycetospora sp. NBRC 106378 TaxID=3032208 RepID=UPI0024A405AC|nr:hypothetical protein [Actinomycetospora sp. NBRC 106378]GLZ51198.1 hypothetical protein Acsp07_08150 [Actinomycetospora sp. NBRC 106378]
MASSADTGTYLLVVAVGTILAVVVGMVLQRSGLGFLREVFDDRDAAQSVSRLLTVAYYLVAVGFIALMSTWDPIEIAGTVQYVVTKIGSMLVFLGILHVVTLAILARIRNNNRVQQMAANLRGGNRRPRDNRGPTQAIESNGS